MDDEKQILEALLSDILPDIIETTALRSPYATGLALVFKQGVNSKWKKIEKNEKN
ncbi:MAG: hypothetical protein ACOCZP_00665 [Candidatus Hadarchaeota archaeon]